MLQKVLKVGSSAAITIPKKSLAELGIAIGETVQVSVNERGGFVVVRPHTPARNREENRSDRIARLTLDFIDRYRKDLEALAKE